MNRALLGAMVLAGGLVGLLATPRPAAAVCPSRPILTSLLTDVCWSCIFPLKVGGIPIIRPDMPDTRTVDQTFCTCPDSIRPGVTVSLWEPIRLIEIVRQPYCFPSLGGLQLGSRQLAHAGTYGEAGDGGPEEAAFYQVHYIAFPLWQLLGVTVALTSGTLEHITFGLFPNLSRCFGSGGFETDDLDLLYLTELDPLWNDDELGALLNPEALLFGNPISQAVCAADCAAASTDFPVDPLFWCAGCWGSLYPFTGTVAGPAGELNTASLLAARALAKFNREFLEAVTAGEGALCGSQYTGFIKKSQYRLQMIHPVPATQAPGCCVPLGRNTLLWGSGRSFPVTGEDFVFLVFRKKDCCAR